MNKHLVFILLFLCLACQDDFTEPIEPSNFLYSGTIQILEDPHILMDGETYPNNLQSGPLQATVSENKETDQIQFTIYGKMYQIYEADFWVEEESCIEFNDLDQVLLERDANGNDIIKIFYPDGFWKDCYYEDEEEKQLVFLIKCRKAFY